MSGRWGWQLLCLSGILAGFSLVTVGNNLSFAARQAAPGNAGMRVRLCTSLPFSHPGNGPLAQGIFNSVTLATEQWRARFRAAHLDLLSPVRLDDSGTPSYDSALEKANASSCVRRSDVLGYVGPLNSGATFISEPILNRAAMLQINPSNTNPALTSPDPPLRRALEPNTSNHRLAYVTFYRLVTTDLLQGPEDASFMREDLHARNYFLVDDASIYGTGVAGTTQAYATRIGLHLVGTVHIGGNSASFDATRTEAVADIIAAKQPDVVFCGCSSAVLGAALAGLLWRKGYSGPLVAPDAFLGQDFITIAGSGAANSYASNEGLDPAGASKSFRSAYARRFHMPLQFYDAFAYDSAAIALHAIYQAATGGRLHGTLFQMRAAILPYVAHERWHGVSGITSFDRNGDTRNAIVSMYAVRNGRWRFVDRAPQSKGVSPTG